MTRTLWNSHKLASPSRGPCTGAAAWGNEIQTQVTDQRAKHGPGPVPRETRVMETLAAPSPVGSEAGIYPLGFCPREKQISMRPSMASFGQGGVQAPTLNLLLAPAPAPVGPCLYLVTLGGFASSAGIWHPRWKISLVRSPWKPAEH